MRVFVYGWYGHGNIGDESYKLSFCHVWPEHQFTFSDKPDNNATYDLCIIGGGDVVRPEALKATEKLLCPRIALSVTITEQSLCEDLRKLKHIYVRDGKSAEVLRKYNYLNYTYLPDISTCLKGDKARGNNVILKNYVDNGLVLHSEVCVVIMNAHLMGTYDKKFYDRITFEKLVGDMASLMDKKATSFLFLPLSTKFPWDDRVSNGIVQSNVKKFNKNAVIYNPLSVQDTIDIIAASDLVITTRFHGLIFGIGNNISTVTLSFHDKFSGFCETINQPYLDYYNTTEKLLTQHAKEALPNRSLNHETIKSDYIEKVHFMRVR